MLTRLWRWLTEPTIRLSEHNNALTHAMALADEYRRAFEETRRALLEERSPGLNSRLSPAPPKPRPVELPEDEEMPL